MKKLITTLSLSVLAALNSSCLMAKPIELDTPDAHIIVVRPLDQWRSGLSDFTENSPRIKFLGRNIYNLGYYDTGLEKNLLAVSAALFSTDQSNVGYFPEIKARYPNKTIAKGMTFRADKPIEVKPSEFAQIAQAQNNLFKKTVIALGDPATLEARINSQKATGNVLGVLSLLVSAIPVVNSAGIGPGVASAFTSDAVNLPQSISRTVVDVTLPVTDLSKYQTIDIRKTTGDQSSGEIIIAYKSAKTQEAEDAAMLLALPVLMSFDETPAEVLSAFTADYEYRKSIWADCIKSGECKTEN